MKMTEDIVEKNILVKAFELEKYSHIINDLYDNDISIMNSNYQINFNGFYRVRRNEKWRKIYYSFFEKNKSNKNITFEEILRYLYKKTNNIEASFASKMLATINHDKPIWDQYVLKNLNLRINTNDKDKRLEQTIEIYKKIENEYNNYLSDEIINKIINNYKNKLNDYNLSDTKILDFILWCER